MAALQQRGLDSRGRAHPVADKVPHQRPLFRRQFLSALHVVDGVLKSALVLCAHLPIFDLLHGLTVALGESAPAEHSLADGLDHGAIGQLRRGVGVLGGEVARFLGHFKHAARRVAVGAHKPPEPWNKVILQVHRPQISPLVADAAIRGDELDDVEWPALGDAADVALLVEADAGALGRRQRLDDALRLGRLDAEVRGEVAGAEGVLGVEDVIAGGGNVGEWIEGRPLVRECLLGVALGEPGLEGIHGEGRDGADARGAAGVREGGVVRLRRSVGVREPCEELVLVELACRGILLVDDEHVGGVRLRPHGHVDVVLVAALGLADVAVGVRHGDGPRLAVGVDAAPLLAGLGLDRDVEALPLEMALAVVAGVLLGWRRLLGDLGRAGDILGCPDVDRESRGARPGLLDGGGLGGLLCHLLGLRDLRGRPFVGQQRLKIATGR